MTHYRGAFFETTTFALKRVDGLFDFAWPTAAALWNLRWQVRGFVDEVPDSSHEALNARFAGGSGIRGLDLRKTCIETSWLEQQEIFAGFILTNVFAIYEHWSDGILKEVGEPVPRSNHPLQINQARSGVQQFIAAKQTSLSAINDSQFYPVYRTHGKYSWPLVGNLMKAYRYFKQARNALIHRGGIADASDEAAYLDFQPVSSRNLLGMRGNLEHEPFVSGQPVKLHLRGVVGFCDIVIRLMRSIDAELCRSGAAEAITAQRLRTGRGLKTMLSAEPMRRREQVTKICKVAGLPKPVDPDAVYAFICNNGIVQI